MAYSPGRYTGDGSTRIYSVPFPYINKGHVKIYLNNVLTTGYTWLSSSQVQLSVAPLGGTSIIIQRETPVDARVVTFTGVSALNPTDLDSSNQQLLNALQERQFKADDHEGRLQSAETTLVNHESRILAGEQSFITKSYLATALLNPDDYSDYSKTIHLKDILVKGPWIDVRAFGVLGDGVTDNANALDTLYRWVESNGGGWIHFPRGTYATSRYGFLNCGNLTITADEGAVLKALNSGTARRGVLMVNNVWDDTGAVRFKNVRIENLTVDMSAVAPVWPSSWDTSWNDTPAINGGPRGGIWVRNCDHVILRGNTILNGVHAGISAVGCYDLLAEGNRVFGLKAVVTSVNNIKDGNGFNFQAYAIGGPPQNLTYLGPYGHWKIINNICIGQMETMPPTYTYTTTNRCNIGFHVEPGGWNTDAKPDQGSPVIFTGNTVERCWFGIVFESQNTADIVHVKAHHNVSRECVFGIMVYPDCIHAGFHNTSRWVDVSHNEAIDSYAIGIQIQGHGVVCIGNTVSEYAMAKTTDLNADGVGWLRLPGNGGGINILPVDSASSSGDYQSLVVAHNIVEKKVAHNTTYMLDGPGIEVAIPAACTLKYIDISHNILDGKGGYSVAQLPHYSGIVILGAAKYVNIESNNISGFPTRGIYVDAYFNVTDFTKSTSHVNVSGNRLIDNGTDGIDRSSMYLRIQTSHIDIRNNTFIDTRTPSYTWTGIEIPQISGADAAVDYLRITGNKMVGGKYNNVDFISVFVSGTNISITDNTGYNNRTSAPSASTVQYYKGTFVKNDTITELGTTPNKYTVQGWDCITTGKPGTWLPRRALTGN